MNALRMPMPMGMQSCRLLYSSAPFSSPVFRAKGFNRIQEFELGLRVEVESTDTTEEVESDA